MLFTILSIFGILITISIVIGVHEYCHFLAARALGVKVLRFSIGFGRVLFRWHDKRGTEYVICILPLGGYVQMLDSTEGKVPNGQLKHAFDKQPHYKKIAIVLAGPLSNLVAAFFLYWAVFSLGFNSVQPIIGEISPRSIAYEAGLRPNHAIIKVDDTNTKTWMSVIIRFFLHIGNKDYVSVTVENLETKQIHTHMLNLSDWHMDQLKPDPLSSLGIIPSSKPVIQRIQYDPITAIPHAFHQVQQFSWFNLVSFAKLIEGKISLQSLGGPIAIFQGAGYALNSGLVPFLSFLGFLNIAIGIINLLPIPGLDGGHILFQFIEMAIRRPIPQTALVFLYRLGFLLLFLLLIQAVANDLIRLF